MKKTIALLLAAATLAHAGTDIEQESDLKKIVVQELAAPSALTGDAGVSMMNLYMAHGISVETKGVVIQPYADLFLKIYRAPDNAFINSVSLQAGIWADGDSDAPLARGATTFKYLTEIDESAGVSVQFAKRYTLTALFNRWDSPIDAYKGGQWMKDILAYDDTGLTCKNFSIQPRVTALYELPGGGPTGFQPHSWYVEPAINPNYTFAADSRYPVNLAVPLIVCLGTGDHGFYNDDIFGFLSVGPTVSVPLSFIPKDYGAWNSSLGYKYYDLGTSCANVAPHGDSSQHYVNFTIWTTF